MRFNEEKNDYSLLSDKNYLDKYFDLPLSRFGRNTKQMKTDIIETKEKYILKVDIPGYDKDDIKIHVGDKYLTVYMKKDREEESTEGKYIYHERFVGTASRSFYIGNINESSITASYKNGTLILDLPKTKEEEEEKTRWIDIN